MLTRSDVKFAALRASRDYVLANRKHLPGLAEKGAFKDFSATVDEIEAMAADQVGAELEALGLTAKLDAQKKSLINCINSLASLSAAAPDFKPPVNMPKLPTVVEKTNVTTLLTTAMGVEATIAPYTDFLTMAGFGEDPVGQLHRAASAVEQTIVARKLVWARGTSLTEGIPKRIQLGLKRLGAVDAFVRVMLSGNKPMLAGWDSVKRVRKVPKPRQGGTVAQLPASTSVQLTVSTGAERMLTAGRRVIRATARIIPSGEYGLRMRAALIEPVQRVLMRAASTEPVQRVLALVRGGRSSNR